MKFASRESGEKKAPPVASRFPEKPNEPEIDDDTFIFEDIPDEGSGVLEIFEGTASYYADKFHGRTTANGETYDMYGLTAAHNFFPFGTEIRVTNLMNGRSCVIRINDRMPVHPDRIIDLSYGTARELDMIKAGITTVRLEILKWGDK